MPDSLQIQLVNQTTSNDVYAFITGLAIRNNMARVFLGADGRGLYYPEPPPPGRILQPLTQDCAIPLGPPGNTVTVTIPQMAGGRIWFSAEKQLTFLRNPGGPGGGAALVEPSVLNPSDPNAGVDFAFCEFTLNDDQLFANITYVDFVPRLPVSLTLRTRGGAVQHVSGMAHDGLERVCAGLREQAARDGWPWDKLIVQPEGHESPLRALNPTHGNAVGASFDGYFEPLVEDAWRKYSEFLQPQPQPQQQQQQQAEPSEEKRRHRFQLSFLSRGTDRLRPAPFSSSGLPPPIPPRPPTTLRINTQAAPGVLEGRVPAGSAELVIGGERFARPTTADILGCNSGPFAPGGASPARLAIIPRLAAAFQRGCVCAVRDHPSDPATFYPRDGRPANHYARVVHECNLDGKGYAFAYDDVQPDGGADQSGKVNAGDPDLLIVAVGGRGAYVGDRMP
ncbi:glycoside hydrolase family 64 protein [Thermothelomyces thermophilus ATCC 42464]|uniref:Glycoside hydrolase family 64 protein n=1 Tax=Thermothelomyces thermophilus (strain ATCC 42464 / BCRC 31852 / DSM 1799) TaxID=573729 RepID=G2QA12_THET4|nr:glycoside hydrolase family 64 protein [Thermothelomyces thermophilus ATCC 42464]AEO56616.1 glycoside hydrolase family 64 protein [Thermothelomyces thermophilus ATCC 42464]